MEIFVICCDALVGWLWAQLLRSHQEKELCRREIDAGKAFHRFRAAECKHRVIGNLHATGCYQQLHAWRVGEHVDRWRYTLDGFIFECFCDRSQDFCSRRVRGWEKRASHKSWITYVCAACIGLLIMSNLYCLKARVHIAWTRTNLLTFGDINSNCWIMKISGKVRMEVRH